MVEQVSIKSDTSNPSLEESAKALGINPAEIDPTELSQSVKERPAWLPDKFKSEEELAVAYAELEKKFSSRNTEEEGETPSEEQPIQEESKPNEGDDDKGENSPEDQAREEAEKAGLDFDALSTKYWEKGALDDSDYEALEKSGIPRHLVDQFAEGRKAIIELERMEVFVKVGGEKAYDDMLGWAAQNFSEAEVEAYNEAVNSSDKVKRMLAVDGLKARYEAERGREPRRVVEGRRADLGSDRYESVAQMQADMAKPEYQKDPAFRARVAAKLSRSDIM